MAYDWDVIATIKFGYYTNSSTLVSLVSLIEDT